MAALVVSAPIPLAAVSGMVTSALSALLLFELFDEQPVIEKAPAKNIKKTIRFILFIIYWQK